MKVEELAKILNELVAEGKGHLPVICCDTRQNSVIVERDRLCLTNNFYNGRVLRLDER